ncbi:hypothetical protein [Scytonema sp. NUACC26]|uniref:hypothetical protein n=1 Tax=Scytonema sp. NUACC26 TaxID=3140176 RepID=UPI0034DB8743
MLYAAATEGIKNAKVKDYVDSILEFAIAEDSKGTKYLRQLRMTLDSCKTIEAEILQKFTQTIAELSLDDGLRLVRESCDKLEQELELLDSDTSSNHHCGEDACKKGSTEVCIELPFHLPYTKFDRQHPKRLVKIIWQ